MPGIAGIIASHAVADTQWLVQRMLASMQHRPDDVQGMVAVPECGLHAGWVAHADSFAARQSSATGRDGKRLLWSGECFTADTGGHPPTSEGEGALLSRHAAVGDCFVDEINGLFSGLLVDPPRRCALLFNDRYGSERLYVHERRGVFYFASEAKALLRVLPELRAFDDEGVADFLAFGSTLEGRTLFRGVAALPGASLIRFSADDPPQRSRYFCAQEWECQEPFDDQAFETCLIDTFARVLPAYAAGEGALGISITGGLDTRMIMACLPTVSPRTVAYTYAASRGETLDASIGCRVAQASGLPHHTLRVPDDFVRHFGRHVDRTVLVTDGCAGATLAHEVVLSEQARALAPTRLTGNFGSEVLRGMSTFKPAGLAPGLLDPEWAPRLSAAVRRMAQRHCEHPVTHAAFEEIPWHLCGSLQAGRSQLTVRTPFLDNAVVALAYRAPARVRASARASLRLVHEKRPELARIATDRGLSWQAPGWREIPRRAYCSATFKLDYWHKDGLPSVLSRAEPVFDALEAKGLLGLHKFLPYRRWFRRELAPYLAEVVDEARWQNIPMWSRRFLETVVDDHVHGRWNRLRELHAIVTLEAVDRLLIRAPRATGA